MLPYHFEPESSDCESIDHGDGVVHGELDILISEWVGNSDWYQTNLRFLHG